MKSLPKNNISSFFPKNFHNKINHRTRINQPHKHLNNHKKPKNTHRCNITIPQRRNRCRRKIKRIKKRKIHWLPKLQKIIPTILNRLSINHRKHRHRQHKHKQNTNNILNLMQILHRKQIKIIIQRTQRKP